MQNKIRLRCLIAGIVLFSSSISSAQNTRIPSVKTIQTEHETLDDPYLPNAFNNKKTSPAYKYKYKSGEALKKMNTGSTIFTNQVNVDAGGLNILGDAANEPNIAVNPLNPNEVVIGWRQFDNVSSNFRQAGWSYTTDGGQTWTFPGVIEPGIFRSDPVLDYDTSGNFYYNSLTITPNYFCKVFKSTNGGASWNNGTDAGGGDKQWMAIDRTAGVGSGNIYSAWSSAFTSCLPGFFTRSSTGGSSFEPCTIVDGNPALGTETVGKGGALYICGVSFYADTIVVAKSTNAKFPGSTINWNFWVLIPINGNIGFNSLINPAGILGQVNIDVDRSNGPGQNNVYVLASAMPFSGDPGDVMFTRSTSGGLTWSPMVKINDDTSQTNTQWFGTLAVAPNGRIDAIWLDTRDNPGSDSSALYYSYSIDQGTTWSANEKLSGSFDPHVGYPNQDKMGDYFDMVSFNSGAHLAWANTFNGEEDVYYSYIVPPVANAVNEISDNTAFSIFPNPTSGKFFITGLPKQSRIEICNVIGEKVYQSFTNSSLTDEELTIDISSQSAGIYFLKIINKDGTAEAKKIIRE